VQLVVPSIEQHLVLPNLDYINSSNEWYRLITVALTHAGLLHLGFNMYSLMVLGSPLEAAFGPRKLLIVFFVSLVTGSFTSAYFASAYIYSVGASGAIFGLFGAFAIVGKKIGADIRSVVVIIGINFVIGFAMGGVDWRAHLGGLIGGVAAAQLVMARR
jgi:membrane associated rhomboid family serine protease